MSFYGNNLLAKFRAVVRAIKVRVFWKKLNSLDLGPIAYKLVMAGWTQQQTTRAIAKYIAFLLLVYLYPNSQLVPTKEIDVVWHNHILDTSKYTKDCQLLFGHFLHHFPYFGVRGETDRQNLNLAFARTKTLFQEHFGEELLVGNDSQNACCEPLVETSSGEVADCEPLRKSGARQNRPRIDIKIADIIEAIPDRWRDLG